MNVHPTLLECLTVQDVRNIENIKLDQLTNITILYGENGSGKTSILEAINILGLSRSFRTNKINTVIRKNRPECIVFGNLREENSERLTPLGISRSSDGKRKIQANQLEIKRISELARLLPIQVIDAQAFKLLEGGPKERRQFLDWGVFHVEHQFVLLWAKLERSVKQRNATLRQYKVNTTPLQVEIWDREIYTLAEPIHRLRKSYFNRFNERFCEIWRKINSGIEIELQYDKGWSVDQPLDAELKQRFELDKRRGLTSIGPHRATIDIISAGRPAHLILSRGQQKLVVSALKITQGQLLRDYLSKKTIYLLDDLPSEFDKSNRKVICRLLEDIDAQLFLTCVEADSLKGCWKNETQVKMFHVEHGTVTEV